MELLDQLSGFKGPKQHYLVHRIAGFSQDSACVLLDVEPNLLRVWRQRDPNFKDWDANIDIHRLEFQEQAIKLLRKANFFTAIQLEKKILEKILEEVTTGKLFLAKTHLARAVYTTAIESLPSDTQHQVPATWEQMILTQGGNQIATATKLTLKAGVTVGETQTPYHEAEIGQEQECFQGQDDQIGEEGEPVAECLPVETVSI